MILNNSYGSDYADFGLKRISHKPGWIGTLIDGETYRFSWEDGEKITNVSYHATFYQFEVIKYQCAVCLILEAWFGILFSTIFILKISKCRIHPTMLRSANALRGSLIDFHWMETLLIMPQLPQWFMELIKMETGNSMIRRWNYAIQVSSNTPVYLITGVDYVQTIQNLV